jgi:hypothetical protein
VRSFLIYAFKKILNDLFIEKIPIGGGALLHLVKGWWVLPALPPLVIKEEEEWGASRPYWLPLLLLLLFTGLFRDDNGWGINFWFGDLTMSDGPFWFEVECSPCWKLVLLLLYAPTKWWGWNEDGGGGVGESSREIRLLLLLLLLLPAELALK